MKLLIVFEMEEKLIPFWNNMKLYSDKRNETVSLVMVRNTNLKLSLSVKLEKNLILIFKMCLQCAKVFST